MFNPAYQQLLQSRGMRNAGALLGSGRTLNTAPPPPAVGIRRGGFGTHFKDTPPKFIEESKVDNKIERIKKPKKKTKRKPKIKYQK